MLSFNPVVINRFDKGEHNCSGWWDSKNNKPHNAFIEKDKSTAINLRWFRLVKKRYCLTFHGKLQYGIWLENNSLQSNIGYRPREDFSPFYSINGKKPKKNWYCEDCDFISRVERCEKCKEECIKVSYRRAIGNKKRKRIYDRDGNKCIKCGAKYLLTLDHTIPVSKGGNCDDDNLQTMCRDCNTAKGNRIINK